VQSVLAERDKKAVGKMPHGGRRLKWA
jgi:hypothetical protein